MYLDIRFRVYSFELRVWNPEGFVGLRVMALHRCQQISGMGLVLGLVIQGFGSRGSGC